MRYGLQGDGAQPVSAGGRLRRDVDAPVLEVGDAPRRPREVSGVVQREAESVHDPLDRPMGERPTRVPCRDHQRLRGPFDVRQVVVAFPHPQPGRGVGPPRLLRCCARLVRTTGQSAFKPTSASSASGAASARRVRRKVQRRIERTALRGLQADLQSRPPARRTRLQQVGHFHPQRLGDRLQHGQPRLPEPVLDEGQLAGAMPVDSATASRVSPAAARKCRIRRPIVRTAVTASGARTGRSVLITSQYLKKLKSY